MKNVEVRKIERRGWTIMVDGRKRGRVSTKEFAVAAATRIAHDEAPSTLTSFQRNGEIDDGYPIILKAIDWRARLEEVLGRLEVCDAPADERATIVALMDLFPKGGAG